MKKNFVLVAVGLGLAQLALLSAAAHAQDTTRALSDVVVTATRSPKKLSDIGRVVTVITSKEINQAQGKTLPELLNTVAGITFSGANNAPGISSSIYLRGASTGNTLILIDGFPVNNASAIDGSYDLNAFSLDQIDHIEILKGTGSTLYGSDAVAGVINIITKHANGQGLINNVQLSGGTYNTFKESYGLNGNLDKTGIALNLSNTDSRGFPAAVDITGKAGFKNDSYHQRSASLNLNQQVSQKFWLNGNIQVNRNSGDLPSGAFKEDNTNTYANTFLLAGIGAKLQLPHGDLKVNASQNNVWNSYNDPATIANDSTHQYTHNTGRITDIQAILNYDLGKHFDLTSGAGYQYSSTSQLSLYNTKGYTPPASVINPDSAHNSITSVYSSLFFKDGVFHMELGGRFNHHSRYGDNFTYTVNPSVILVRQLKLFITAASAFKAPSLYQLSSQYGNPFLNPETTKSYEAGFDWQIVPGIFSFNSVFYRNNTKDVIYFFTDPISYNSYYKNGEQQKDKGFESQLKLNVHKLTASAYWAYVTGSLTNEKGITTNNLFRRPKNTLGADVFYEFCKNFSAGLNYKLTGDRADENFNAPPYPAIITLRRYSLVDAHLQLGLSKQISLFSDFKNVFNEKYTDWLGYNTRGFNFMVGVRCQF